MCGQKIRNAPRGLKSFQNHLFQRLVAKEVTFEKVNFGTAKLFSTRVTSENVCFRTATSLAVDLPHPTS